MVISCPGKIRQTLLVNAAGTYTLTVTDPDNGCTSEDLTTVSDNFNSPLADAGAALVINCSNTAVI